MGQQGHPVVIGIDRILPLLAKEIYETPLAFLRENVQNAYDAIRIQIHREELAGIVDSSHHIRISIESSQTEISDTGIGMSAEDMRMFYWSIGVTGKATEEAAQAGVVGTFGIGGSAHNRRRMVRSPGNKS